MGTIELQACLVFQFVPVLFYYKHVMLLRFRPFIKKIQILIFRTLVGLTCRIFKGAIIRFKEKSSLKHEQEGDPKSQEMGAGIRSPFSAFHLP